MKRRSLRSRLERPLPLRSKTETNRRQEIDANDLDTFHRFNPPISADPTFNLGDDPPDGAEGGQTINLADLILQKIAQHEAAEEREELPNEEDVELPPMAVEVYTQ
jgi:essential nuclear protein 1